MSVFQLMSVRICGSQLSPSCTFQQITAFVSTDIVARDLRLFIASGLPSESTATYALSPRPVNVEVAMPFCDTTPIPRKRTL